VRAIIAARAPVAVSSRAHRSELPKSIATTSDSWRSRRNRRSLTADAG
jgi:hypothetical protein